ncbi:MAG: nickel-dependent lactate racemase [candidate division Zixibacteria bacterium]|nr:nickel-dependent lactate racemase [candidate division Zixibacteria bacterium]
MPQNLKIPYGKSYQSLIIPDSVEVVEVGKGSGGGDESIDIHRKLAESDLVSFVKNASDLLIIINDHTRFTPSGTILSFIKQHVGDNTDLEILIATGTHRAPTDSELRTLLGNCYQYYKAVTKAHDCLDDDSHFYAGKTASGIDMHLNKAIDRHDNILVVGSVEPHFFAGFTGGRKGIFPGVASKKSIVANHVKAIDRDAQPLQLHNPIHYDMDAIIDLLQDKNIFSVQTVHRKDRSIAGVYAGDIRGSFKQAAWLAKNVYVYEERRQFDIVIAVVRPPLDIDLYQIQKGFENTKFGVKPGGVSILVSECRDGVGPDDWLKLSANYDSAQDVLNNSQDASNFGFHKLYRPARFMRQSRIFVVSEVAPFLVESVFLTPKSDLQKAFDDAVKLIESCNSALIVYDAGQNVISINTKKDLQ